MTSKYETATLKVADRIATYFVHIVYNSLYKAAKIVHENGQYPTVTEAYRAKLSQLAAGIYANDPYKQFLNSFHLFYQEKVEPGITFDKFTIVLLSQFIPSDYFKDLTGPQRDGTLRKILTGAFGELAKVIKEKWVPSIIDDHKNVVNVEHLKKIASTALLTIRDAYWSKFATGVNDANGVGVPFSIFEEAKSALIRTQNELASAVRDRERAIFMINQMVAKMNRMQDEITALSEKLALNEKIILNERSSQKSMQTIIRPPEPEPEPTSEDIGILESVDAPREMSLEEMYASSTKTYMTLPDSDTESEE